MATTVYLNDEVERIAKDRASRTQVPISKVVQDCLLREASLGATREEFVVLPAMTESAGNADGGAPAITEAADSREDQYLLAAWLLSEPTDRVLLMGRSLLRPLTWNSELWAREINSGLSLFVLLQAPATPDAMPGVGVVELDEMERRRRSSLEVLAGLSESTAAGRLEVRRTLDAPLPFGVIALFRRSGMVDLQIQPLAPLATTPEFPRFVLRAPERSERFRLLWAPIEAVWRRSVSEPLATGRRVAPGIEIVR